MTRKEQLAAVAVEDMVVFSPEGETRDYIAVFTDVTCFYCQRPHREVDQLTDKGIEVRYLAFPCGGANGGRAEARHRMVCRGSPDHAHRAQGGHGTAC